MCGNVLPRRCKPVPPENTGYLLDPPLRSRFKVPSGFLDLASVLS